MTNLQARLDRIRDRIRSEEFLHGRGLGNDVPFYAFDYPSVSEQQVNNHIEWLLEDLARKTGLKIGVVNMFELAVEQLKKRDLYAKALAMEKAKGVSSLLSALKGPLEPGKMAAALLDKFGGMTLDMLFLTGVGPAYPLIRFRGQSLTGDSDLDSRLTFGGSLGRADWRYRRGMGSDRAAVAA